MFGEIEQSNRQTEQYETLERFFGGFFALSE